MRTMRGSDMEISVGNKQLHENKHAQCHSQSSEHITVITKMRATNTDPEQSVCALEKEAPWGGAVTLSGHVCDWVCVCVHARLCVCLLRHMNFI